MQTRWGVDGGAPNGVSSRSGTRPWSPVRQVSTGTASVNSAAPTIDTAASAARSRHERIAQCRSAAATLRAISRATSGLPSTSWMPASRARAASDAVT
jgi:hypothetical protein